MPIGTFTTKNALDMKSINTQLILCLFLLSIVIVSCSGDDDQPATPYLSILSGVYDAEARMFGPEPNVNCPDTIWYGQVRWVAEHNEGIDTIGTYRLDSKWNALNGDWHEDPSMGSYFQCYLSEVDPTILPNGTNQEGTLRLVDTDGQFSWTGISQWGEVYFFTEVEADGVVLLLRFENDYAEVFEVRLIRTDGTSWPADLSL